MLQKGKFCAGLRWQQSQGVLEFTRRNDGSNAIQITVLPVPWCTHDIVILSTTSTTSTASQLNSECSHHYAELLAR